jgi:WD40 repeat protein
VYYKDFSTIVVLDRLLNVRNTIDLRKQNILQVRAVTASYDNNIWLYDELDNKIKKIDDNGRVRLESNDFRQVYKSVPSPEVIFDRDGQLYLYDPKKGLLVYDYYGAQKNNYPLNDLSDLQVIDKNTITARDSSHIILFKPSSLQLLSFSAFKNQRLFTKIHFNGNRLMCLSKEGFLSSYTTINRL